MLKWLFLGMSLIIQINDPLIFVEDGCCLVQTETPGMLTSEMEELVLHGVDFEFLLYGSLRYMDETGKSDFRVCRQTKKIIYDLRENQYQVYLEGALVITGALEEIRNDLEQWCLRFPENSADGRNYDLFMELSLLKNEMIETRLGDDTSHLWNHYRPVKKVRWEEFY